eukprot:Tamp_16127.p2 GENE.Tamp_16127~~Tamp_16127.p2  ORF type:complete len:120 (+),score=19.21 Tamp_16127:583-942(+)
MIVRLERACAEKDSLIRDLEAEVRRLDGALGEETTLAETCGREGPGGGEGGRGEGGDGLAISDISVDSTLDSLKAAGEGEVDTEGRGEEVKERLEAEMRGLVAELMQERKVSSRLNPKP